MGFFLIPKRDEKLEQLNTTLNNSFGNVKRDIFKIFEWLNYLYHNNLHQSRVIEDLQKQLKYMPKTQEEFKALIDAHYSLVPIQHKLSNISAKIDSFEESHNEMITLKYHFDEIKTKIHSLEANQDSLRPLMQRLEEIKSKISALEEAQEPLKKHLEEHTSIKPEMPQNSVNIAYRQQQPSAIMGIRERLIRKIAKSSKDHVKSLIKSLIIKYGQISALHLREIVVEEQGLSSKSSFYRILEELETDEDISVMHDKKEKKYAYNTLKSNYSKI
jgi:predicted RNase H-like nuclease (RuvC/YqgF family)